MKVLSRYARRTLNQEKYVKSLRDRTKSIVIATGPPGSGKTFLACQEGAQQIVSQKMKHLVITRPTRTVDEDHGYLPGDISKKLGPWVQPIYDSLEKTSDSSMILNRTKLKDSVEIAPLAYMRGRTFENSWIVADEMQNATPAQMKMLLTRIGTGSKLIVNGDLSQSDVEYSGLEEFLYKLKWYPDPKYIDLVELDANDIIRHEAVKEVLEIYKNPNSTY